MKYVFRWFPFGDDSVTLEQIRQIPMVNGVVPMLSKVAVGEVWPLETLQLLKAKTQSYGLHMEVIESVNIHEDIKQGLPSRDKYIQNYIKTLENLATVGVKCLCYNFMPVMDWARSSLFHKLPDNSTVMLYEHDEVIKRNPANMGSSMLSESNGYTLPGWEPERLEKMAKDIEFYQNITQEQYWDNMKYFLNAVIPSCERLDIKMAIHPDDPPFSIYGLPKVINSSENIDKFLKLYDSPYNGLTLCTGSLGADKNNDIPNMIRKYSAADRVHFVHLRNIKHTNDTTFYETAHPTACGELDMYKIVKALVDTDYNGYARPDHGRMIWGENARPGYGLYDRALGITYIVGLEEAIKNSAKER